MLWSGIVADFRFAVRRLAAAPLFTLFAIVSLALGVGVTTVAYAVVGDLFFASVNVRDPGDVVAVVAPRSGVLRPASVARLDFDELQRALRSFDSVAAWTPVIATVVGADRTALLPAEAVSGGYFRTAGVDAVRGRMIQPEDEATLVAVLSDTAWRELFHSDASVVGRAIRINGRAFDVIGVAPADYSGVVDLGMRQAAVWIPLAFADDARDERAAGAPAQRTVSVIGRLRRAQTVEAAATELVTLASALDRSRPRSIAEQGPPRIEARGWTARPVVEIYEAEIPINRLGMVLAALVTLVLLVACTNLANLVLARGTLRQQDVTVRRALGASHWRLVREQLAESSLIAAGGAVATYGVMQVTAAAAARDLPLFAGLTLSIRPDVGGSTLAVAAIALLVSLIVFGLEPAIRLVRTADVRGPLATITAGMGRVGRYRLLLRWQVAAATAFFIIAVLMIRYVIADAGHDPGIRLDGLVVAQVNMGQRRDAAAIRRTIDRLLGEGRRESHIDSMAIATALPFGTGSVPFGTATARVRLSRPDSDSASPATSVDAPVIHGTPDLLSVLGVPILRGRALRASDAVAPPRAAVVNARAALALFGTMDVVGREIRIASRGTEPGADIATIVGVSADTDTTVYMSTERQAVLYAPLVPGTRMPSTIAVRAKSDGGAAAAALQAAIRRADPDVAVERSGAAWQMLAGPFTLVRFVGNASVSLGGLTLMLAMVGLYGIQSQGVTLRTREIGVRVSFGASAAQIRRMILKDGYRPVAEGLLLGLVGGIAGRIFIRIYLDVQISVLDPWMLALVPLPLVLSAFCAGYLPARRAARVDPAVALRDA